MRRVTMGSAGITADRLEFSANQTLAYAILATEAHNEYLRLYRMSKVLSELRKMLPLLTVEFCDSLAEGQKNRLFLRLQDAHVILAEFSGSNEAESIVRHLPLLKALVGKCQEAAEDLGDVLDSMRLARNGEFETLLVSCKDNVRLTVEGPISGFAIAQDRSPEKRAQILDMAKHVLADYRCLR